MTILFDGTKRIQAPVAFASGLEAGGGRTGRRDRNLTPSPLDYAYEAGYVLGAAGVEALAPSGYTRDETKHWQQGYRYGLEEACKPSDSDLRRAADAAGYYDTISGGAGF